jgi:hypothetical protein
MQHRPLPFYSTNDRLDPVEVRRQVASLIDHGYSGVLFHARAGLATPYLGDAWMQAFAAAVQGAKDGGGTCWIYDEDRWPSGNAGGLISAQNEAYRATSLVPHFIPAGASAPLAQADDRTRATYRVTGRRGATVERVERIDLDGSTQDVAEFDRLVLVTRPEPRRDWWGGESDSNLLEPAVTRQYIRLTHDLYEQQFGSEFGRSVPGIFTDEPNLLRTDNAVPWWDGLVEAYRSWHERDFWADVPWLYLDGPLSRKVRLLVHRTLSRQFAEAYSKPLFDWCDARGMKLTGHFLEESGLHWQLRCASGPLMPHYRYLHTPGFDHLMRQVEGPLPVLLGALQVRSAARQLGRPDVLVECYAAARHTSTFEDLKWISDSVLALGGTLLNPHGSHYSMRGKRKRDYPPNFNYQQTYFDDLPTLNDYLARLGYVLSCGRGAPDALVLHPIGSAMAVRRFALRPPAGSATLPGDLPIEDVAAVDAIDAPLRRTVEALMNAGCEMDFGDEDLMQQLDASTTDGRIQVGQMRYGLVIVPPSTTWRPSTIALLESFVAGGGKLLFVGDPPSELDAEPARARWQALVERPGVRSVPCSPPHLHQAFEELSPDRRFRLRAADGSIANRTFVQHRVCVDGAGPGDVCFIVNADRDRAQQYRLRVGNATGYTVWQWDALHGTRTRLMGRPTGIADDVEVELDLPPAGSVLLVVERTVDTSDAPGTIAFDGRPAAAKTIAINGPWDFARSEPNVLVLDHLSASVDGGRSWIVERAHNVAAHRVLAAHFGMTDALTWQPWVAERKGRFADLGGEVLLRYRFTARCDPASLRTSAVVVEDRSRCVGVKINGQPLDIGGDAWHFDRTFAKLAAGHLLRPDGENVIDVTMRYDHDTPIEPAYVIGDFGVALSGSLGTLITDLPPTLAVGSWVSQGLPFYAGRITYRMQFPTPPDATAVRLRLRRPSAIVTRVRLNGADRARIMWRPHELDLTPALRPGVGTLNDLEVELVSSCQNTLGPLHEVECEGVPAVCSPAEFEEPSRTREAYSLFDHGLLDGVELLVFS